MLSTCCRCLFFLCYHYQRVRVKGKVVKHHESTQMLLHWEKVMVMLHLQAGSPVLARNTHSTASGAHASQSPGQTPAWWWGRFQRQWVQAQEGGKFVLQRQNVLWGWPL